MVCVAFYPVRLDCTEVKRYYSFQMRGIKFTSVVYRYFILLKPLIIICLFPPGRDVDNMIEKHDFLYTASKTLLWEHGSL